MLIYLFRPTILFFYVRTFAFSDLLEFLKLEIVKTEGDEFDKCNFSHNMALLESSILFDLLAVYFQSSQFRKMPVSLV